MKTQCAFLTCAATAAMLLATAPAHTQSGSTYRFESKYSPEAEAPALGKGANTTVDTPTALVSIVTDLSRSTAGNGEEQSRISNGKLGISFVTKHFYGDLSFAVLANGRESSAGNLGDTAFFYNNLLLAQNRTGGLSEFSGSIGVNSPK